MTADTAYLMRREEPQTRFRDLDRVRVTSAVSTDDGDHIVVGSEGTVVGIWRDGAAYEVEFAYPPGALATVNSDDLALVAHAATRHTGLAVRVADRAAQGHPLPAERGP